MYSPGPPAPRPDGAAPSYAAPFELGFPRGANELQVQPGAKLGGPFEPPATTTFNFAGPGARAAPAPPFDFPPARSLGAPLDGAPGSGRPPLAPPPASPFDLALGPSGASSRARRTGSVAQGTLRSGSPAPRLAASGRQPLSRPGSAPAAASRLTCVCMRPPGAALVPWHKLTAGDAAGPGSARRRGRRAAGAALPPGGRRRRGLRRAAIRGGALAGALAGVGGRGRVWLGRRPGQVELAAGGGGGAGRRRAAGGGQAAGALRALRVPERGCGRRPTLP